MQEVAAFTATGIEGAADLQEQASQVFTPFAIPEEIIIRSKILKRTSEGKSTIHLMHRLKKLIRYGRHKLGSGLALARQKGVHLQYIAGLKEERAVKRKMERQSRKANRPAKHDGHGFMQPSKYR